MVKHDELAAKRFYKEEWSKNIKPVDALNACIADIEKENIQSVIVIAVDKNGEQWSYSGGPHTKTFMDVWRVLQSECLIFMTRLMDSE